MKCRVARQNQTMPTTIDDFAQKWAADLGRDEADKTGLPLPMACRSVARRMGLPLTSIDNIRRKRVKSVSARVMDRIRGAVINKINQQIAVLDHELAGAKATADHPSDPEILEAAAVVEPAKRLMRGQK